MVLESCVSSKAVHGWLEDNGQLSCCSSVLINHQFVFVHASYGLLPWLPVPEGQVRRGQRPASQRSAIVSSYRGLLLIYQFKVSLFLLFLVFLRFFLSVPSCFRAVPVRAEDFSRSLAFWRQFQCWFWNMLL